MDSGDRRPGACAVQVAKIATSEIEETYDAPTDWATREKAQECGRKGGRAQAALLTPERRRQITKTARRCTCWRTLAERCGASARRENCIRNEQRPSKRPY